MTPARDAAADAAAGCLAGSANIFVGFPFDTIKVQMQSHRGAQGAGALATCRALLARRGLPGLFRGLSPQILGGAAEAGVNYATYEDLVGRARSTGLPEAIGVPLASAAAGVALSLVLGPTELIKCRMQVSVEGGAEGFGGGGAARRHHATAREAVAHLVRSEGPLGLARGLGSTVIREVPGNAVYFSTYALFRALVARAVEEQGAWTPSDGGGKPAASPASPRSPPPTNPEPYPLWVDMASSVFCGGAAGVAMWAVVFPLDAAKTRVQLAERGAADDIGFLGHLRALRRSGALYKGLGPTLARAFPSNAAQWVAYELAQRAFGRARADTC